MSLPSSERSLFSFRAACVLVVAWGFDALGEPPARRHPVVWYGKLIRVLERWAPQRSPSLQFVHGCAMLLLAGAIVLPPLLLIQRALIILSHFRFGRLFSVLLTGLCLKPFFALHMLASAGRSVRHALEHDNLALAREELRALVSRDRAHLTRELVAAAVVESLAENVSDSVVAPLFYYALFGLPGAALYRLYNTFDSMLGYHGRYEYLGKASARFDDLLNLVPARLTAGFIILTSPFFAGNPRAAFRIWRRDARQTESPNAGHPMSAMAGALDVCLEKVDHYRLGDPIRPVTPLDIKRSERMVYLVSLLAFVLVAVWRGWRGGRDA